MKKSVHSQEQKVLEGLLRRLRNDAGLLQAELAARLGKNQTFVSHYETGEKMLDLVEIRQVVHVLGLTLPEFVDLYETTLAEATRTSNTE